jgi:hypothetical protein
LWLLFVVVVVVVVCCCYIFFNGSGHFWSKVGDFMQIFWIVDYFHAYAVVKSQQTNKTHDKQTLQQEMKTPIDRIHSLMNTKPKRRNETTTTKLHLS